MSEPQTPENESSPSLAELSDADMTSALSFSASSQTPPKTPKKRFCWFRWLLLSLVLLILLVAGALAWIVATPGGSQFAVSKANKYGIGIIKIEGWTGRLWDEWHVERFDLTLSSFQLHATQLDVLWQLRALLGEEADIQVLRVNTLEIRTAPSEKKPGPVKPPVSLAIGLDAHVEELRARQLIIGTLVAEGPQPEPDVILSDIEGRLDSRGGVHRADKFAVITPVGRVTGQASIATMTPFALEGQLHLTSKVDALPVEVDAQVAGTLLILHIALKAKSDEMTGQGDVLAQPFSLLPVLRAQLEFNNVDPSVFSQSAPHAKLDVKVNVTPSVAAGLGHEPTVEDWRATGPIEIINHSAAPVDQKGIPVERLSAQLDWSSGRLVANALHVELPSVSSKDKVGKQKLQSKVFTRGELNGQVKWVPTKADVMGHIEGDLTLKNIDPAQIAKAAQSMQIDGQITAKANSISQQVEAKLKSDIFQLNALAEHRNNTVFLKQIQLTAGEGKALVSGQMALTGDKKFSAQGSMTKVNPRIFVKTAPQGNINAQFDVSGRLAPSWQTKVSLDLGQSMLAGRALSGQGQMELSPGRIANADVNLNILENLIKVQGGYGKPGDELKYTLDAAHLDRLSAGFGGTAYVDGTLRGTIGTLSGAMTAKVREFKAPGDVSIDSLDVQANMQDGINGLVQAKVSLNTLRVGSEQQIGKDDKARAAPKAPIVRSAGLQIDGRRKEHTLSAFAEVMEKERVDLAGKGGWQDDNSWKGVIQTLQAKGPIAFQLLQSATLDASANSVVLGPAQLKAQNGDVVLERTEWSMNHIIAKGHVTGVQVGLSVDQNQRTIAQGRTLRLGGEWDINFGEKAQGLIHVAREGGDMILQGDVPVAMGLDVFEASLAAQDDRLTLTAIANGKRIGAINVAASASTLGKGSNVRLNPDAPLVGVASIQMPSIDWLGPFINQNIQLAGSVRGDFNVLGTPSKPQGSGKVQGDNLVVGMADQGMRLTDGQLVLSFDAAQVLLETLSFKSANTLEAPDSRLRALGLTGKAGTLMGSGNLQLSSGKGTFHLDADKVGVLQEHNQWMLASGTADIDSGWNEFNLVAKMQADAGYIGVPKNSAPSLSDDVVVRGSKLKEPPSMRMNADITFGMGKNFILKAYGIDTYLDGTLKLRIADGPMRATGAINTRNGAFDAYGRRLEVERGIVTFQGPINNPALNVVALRKGLPVEAGVEVTGTAQAPRVRLVSEPNVPETEKLSWILLGRASEAGATDTGLLLSAASAMLGGSSGEGGLVDKIAHGIGLDEISVSDQTTGATGVQSQVARGATGLGSSVNSASGTGGQVVTLGKRISSSAYVALEQNFSGTESVVKLTYSLTRFVSVILQTGTDNALDVSYSISFK